MPVLAKPPLQSDMALEAANLRPKETREIEGPPTRTLGPMMQQSTVYGYEMHPQEFVRLIGCHQSNRLLVAEYGYHPAESKAAS